jgi:hypothetical protein
MQPTQASLWLRPSPTGAKDQGRTGAPGTDGQATMAGAASPPHVKSRVMLDRAAPVEA